MDIRTIIKINELIVRRATGNPKQLGLKLNLSERAVYNYLKFMKEELNAPIVYSKARGSYQYEEFGGFMFRWGDTFNLDK